MSTLQDKSKSSRGLRGALRTVVFYAGLAMMLVGLVSIVQGITPGWQVLTQGSVLVVVARCFLR